MRTELGVLAMIHGDEDIPPDLLPPPEQRLTGERIIQEHNAGEAVLEEFMAKASAALQ
jgi:hypothetical protein